MSGIRRIFSPPQQPTLIMPPPPQPAPPMPDPGNPQAAEAARRKVTSAQTSGRESTILSSGNNGDYSRRTLGG